MKLFKFRYLKILYHSMTILNFFVKNIKEYLNIFAQLVLFLYVSDCQLEHDKNHKLIKSEDIKIDKDEMNYINKKVMKNNTNDVEKIRDKMIQ